MKRREFITLLGGTAATAWPLAAGAQQAERVRRVGVLSNFAESDPEAQSMVDALHQTLQGLGWVEAATCELIVAGPPVLPGGSKRSRKR